MGPGKYLAWKDDKFNFAQLATLKKNKIWGASAQVTSLERLLGGGGGINPPKVKL